MNPEIYKLKDFIEKVGEFTHQEGLELIIQEKMHIHKMLLGFKHKAEYSVGLDELIHANKTEVLTYANEYITTYNELPRISLGAGQ